MRIVTVWPSIRTLVLSIGSSVLFLRISEGFSCRDEAYLADRLASLSTAFVLGLFFPGTRSSQTGFPCLPERTTSRTKSFHCLALSTGLPSLVTQPFRDQTETAIPKFSAT